MPNWVKTSFFRYGHIVTGFRDTRTGQFTSQPVHWRASVGLNGCVKHGIYRNFTIVRFYDTELEAKNAMVDLKWKLVTKAEEWLGYDVDEWWTMPAYIGEEIRAVFVE